MRQMAVGAQAFRRRYIGIANLKGMETSREHLTFDLLTEQSQTNPVLSSAH
jgi:hypothetical protein